MNFPPDPAATPSRATESRHRAGVPKPRGVEPHVRLRAACFSGSKAGRNTCPQVPDTDVTANLEGYTSITPLRADLTAYEMLASLKERLEE